MCTSQRRSGGRRGCAIKGQESGGRMVGTPDDPTGPETTGWSVGRRYVCHVSKYLSATPPPSARRSKTRRPARAQLAPTSAPGRVEPFPDKGRLGAPSTRSTAVLRPAVLSHAYPSSELAHPTQSPPFPCHLCIRPFPRCPLDSRPSLTSTKDNHRPEATHNLLVTRTYVHLAL